jgi:molybdopterin molybdotransferase
MLTVEEALAHVLDRAKPRPARPCALSEALGLVLDEAISSDVDSPPHDKSIVDGYAVRAQDLMAGQARLTIIEEIVAGYVPQKRVESGQAARIMTGAPVPDGADAVVMVERTELLPASDGSLGQVRIQDERFAAGQNMVGQNIVRRGAAFKRGEVLLTAGHRLRPLEIGLLAEVGRTQVRAIPRPTVAVLSTGDELVPYSQLPGPGQIRNSNEPMLLACVQRAGGTGISLGIGRDDRLSLRTLIEQGLAADVLVLSGGVSAGVLDLVPGVLKELGVEQIFHKVRVKPGKPLWFGVLASSGIEKLVFGLPGNPVSSLVCFELFVRPAIAQLARHHNGSLGQVRATLTADVAQRGERTSYVPARLTTPPAGSMVEPLRSQGSGDLRALAAANALIRLPSGDRTFRTGEVVDVILID